MEVVGFYIGLYQKWPAAKVEATGDLSINNRKVFPGVGTYVNGYIADGVFFNFYVVWRVEVSVPHFIKLTLNWNVS